MRRLLWVMMLLAVAVGATAQTNGKKKPKSAKQLSKQYVDYVRNKNKGKSQLAQRGASDPATVTRKKRGMTADDSTLTFEEQYRLFRQQANADYEGFRKLCNENYAQFLKEAWKLFRAAPSVASPKDETVPPVIMQGGNEASPTAPRPIMVDTVVRPEMDIKKPQPLPIAPIREITQPAENYVDVAFYGTECRGRMPKAVPAALQALNTDLSEENMSEAWAVLSGGDFDNLVRDCLEERLRHQFCDWGYLLLCRELSEKFCGGSCNAATMLTAWIYCQSGYLMRLATNAGKLYLLFGTQHLVYDWPGFNIDGMRFYALLHAGEAAITSAHICDAPFPNEQPMSLYLRKAVLLDERLSAGRTIQSARYPEAVATVRVNQNLIDFYNSYPTSEFGGNVCSRWAIYADTPIAKEVSDSLYPQLRKAILGKSQADAANILLNWIQTGFAYEYDDKVWGRDRAFFAEETLYYPYCDCEDRAILYTRLVRDLLGLKCLLVFYPGHLAAAVNFTDNVSGDWLTFDGRKFVVADPTYIGAPVGRTMPGMDNKTAKVVVVE